MTLRSTTLSATFYSAYTVLCGVSVSRVRWERTVAARSVGNARISLRARSIIEGAAMAHNVPIICVRWGVTPPKIINRIKLKNMHTDSKKHDTPIDANNVLAVVLIEQLDKWIEDCQAQADVFFERGMTVSETSSLAMKVAYMNVKTLVENNR